MMFHVKIRATWANVPCLIDYSFYRADIYRSICVNCSQFTKHAFQLYLKYDYNPAIIHLCSGCYIIIRAKFEACESVRRRPRICDLIPADHCLAPIGSIIDQYCDHAEMIFPVIHNKLRRPMRAYLYFNDHRTYTCSWCTCIYTKSVILTNRGVRFATCHKCAQTIYNRSFVLPHIRRG